MRLLRRLARLARLLPHIARGWWQCATRLPAKRPPRGEREWNVIHTWFREALRIIGVEVRVHGEAASGPVLFVANHVSWLDIAAVKSVVDTPFVGKHELASWPVLGFLIARGGTVFIERGGSGAAAGAVRQMSERLGRGDRVAVFPEGTTSRGGDVRRFHPRLFEAARASGARIQPIAIRYDSAAAPFVDDASFVSHLWRLLAEPRVTVDLWLLPPIPAAGRDRRSLATDAHAAIAATLDAGAAGAAPAATAGAAD